MRVVMPFLIVGVGGFAGSVARFALSLLAQRYSVSFPHGTLWANLLGCLAIGAVAGIAARGEFLSPSMRLLLATGICGGFTTMSSFVYELAQMLRDREALLAAGYFGITLAGGLIMFWAGAAAVRVAWRGW